jgi:dodecin
MLEQRCGRSTRNISACSGHLSIVRNATNACNCLARRNHKRAASILSEIIKERRITNHAQSRQSHRTAIGIAKELEDAAQSAVSEASKTLRNIRSIYIKEFTAAVDNGKVTSYRINSKVTFDLETERGKSRR